MASPSAIADALVNLLSATSVLGACAVSKGGYQLLESTASAAAMVKFRELDLGTSNFGGNYSERWDFEIRCFVRDTGDPHLATNRVWTVTNKVVTCLRGDYTIQNTVDDVRRISGYDTPEEVMVVNGVTWLPITFRVQAVIL